MSGRTVMRRTIRIAAVLAPPRLDAVARGLLGRRRRRRQRRRARRQLRLHEHQPEPLVLTGNAPPGFMSCG